MPNSDPKVGGRYLQSILFLMVMLAIFALVNGVLNIIMMYNLSHDNNERAEETREIVIIVGSCLAERSENFSEATIRKCVEKRMREINADR